MGFHLKDLLPSHQTELLLSFDEFVETWGELIEATHAAIMSDEEMAPSFDLDGEGFARLSVEAALILCRDAMRTWRQGRRLSDSFCDRLEAAVVEDVAVRMMGDGAASEFPALYKAQGQILSQLLPDTGRLDEDSVRRQLIAASRYAASLCSPRAEEDNVAGIECLSIHLSQAHALFAKLDANSIPDGNTLLFKKPRFIVREVF